MRPFLFNIGDLQIPSFFFMVMVATLAATFYGYWVSSRVGLKREVFLDFGMIGMVAGVLGTRIFHILVEAPDYYWEDPLRVFEFWRGGFVSFGAYIGVSLSIYLYLRIRKFTVAPYLDVLALCTPIIQFCIRLACLLTGCCYGKPTDLSWAITFTDPASTAYYYYPNIPLHPVQIYSGIHAIILFIAINWFYWKKRRFPGQTACLMMLGYLIPRGLIELFRADADRGLWFYELISTGQIASLVGCVFVLILYFRLKRRYGEAESR